MEYKDIRENLEEMMNDNYKDFIKALVSIEKGVNDEKALEEVYVLYMNNDTTGLLSDDFDYMIDDMKEQGKLIENTNELEEKDDLIKYLTTLKGVGVWTAEMILLFCLQRPNVFSFDDLAIQRGLRMVYHHRKIDRKLFEKYKRRFTPYCSVASLYLWAVSNGAIPEMRDYAPKNKR